MKIMYLTLLFAIFCSTCKATGNYAKSQPRRLMENEQVIEEVKDKSQTDEIIDVECEKCNAPFRVLVIQVGSKKSTLIESFLETIQKPVDMGQNFMMYNDNPVDWFKTLNEVLESGIHAIIITLTVGDVRFSNHGEILKAFYPYNDRIVVAADENGMKPSTCQSWKQCMAKGFVKIGTKLPIYVQPVDDVELKKALQLLAENKTVITVKFPTDLDSIGKFTNSRLCGMVQNAKENANEMKNKRRAVEEKCNRTEMRTKAFTAKNEKQKEEIESIKGIAEKICNKPFSQRFADCVAHLPTTLDKCVEARYAGKTKY